MMVDVWFVVIGDLFMEGVGDVFFDGWECGWVDFVVQGWVDVVGYLIQYVNLVICGKFVWFIVEQQLELVFILCLMYFFFNGGGNDMLCLCIDVEYIVDVFSCVFRWCDEEGVMMILFLGVNLSGQLLMGFLVQWRGDLFLDVVLWCIEDCFDVICVFNWFDWEFVCGVYWFEDCLYMNVVGYYWVVVCVLYVLGFELLENWWVLSDWFGVGLFGFVYYWEFVGFWVCWCVMCILFGDGWIVKFLIWVEWVLL